MCHIKYLILTLNNFGDVKKNYSSASRIRTHFDNFFTLQKLFIIVALLRPTLHKKNRLIRHDTTMDQIIYELDTPIYFIDQ